MADVTVSPEEVIAYAREHVAIIRCRIASRSLDTFALNASGNVQKTVLRERVAHATTA